MVLQVSPNVEKSEKRKTIVARNLRRHCLTEVSKQLTQISRDLTKLKNRVRKPLSEITRRYYLKRKVDQNTKKEDGLKSEFEN